MRTLLGSLTVVAVSIQNADSWNPEWRRCEVIRTDGPHPAIELQWGGLSKCVLEEVQMDDPTGRRRTIDLSDKASPYLVKSTDEFPIAHWINYTVWFGYDCQENHLLFFTRDVRVWEELSVKTGNGEPLPLQNLEISTESSSATVRWGVPDLIKHSCDRASCRVLALLLEIEDYPSEPRRMTSTLEVPLVVQLAPGVVYTVVLNLEIQGHQSEPIKTKFIVDALEEQTTLDVSVNRTETTAELVWGSTKKQNLSFFIDHYSIEGLPSFLYKGFILRKKNVEERRRRFTIDNLTGSDKFHVVIRAHLRCGNRIIAGAKNTVSIEALQSSPPDSSDSREAFSHQF